MIKIHAKFLVTIISLFAIFAFVSFPANAQSVEEAARKVAQLTDAGNFAEAAPYLAILVNAEPDSADLRFLYGFSLLAKSKLTNDKAEEKKLVAEALVQCKKSKELGNKESANELLIQLLSGDGSGISVQSSDGKDSEAEKFMTQAEANFAQGKYKEAFKYYQKALEKDPKLYTAALYSGDCFNQLQDWENAEIWYQAAIKIDPTRETGYRYSATPFMKQKKYDIARERYIEAFITEPYNKSAQGGLNQWSEVTETFVGHPTISIPEIETDENGKMALDIDPKDATKLPWLSYLVIRESWKKEKFGKTFTNEKRYRHSLQEETEAIRGAIAEAKLKKVVNTQIQKLEKLDSEGLLESYILLAKPDQGIAEDHAEYLKNNREKLRMYVSKYVIQTSKREN